MKKIFTMTLVLICLLGLCGCNSDVDDTTAQTEVVSADYGKVIDLAKEVIVQFKYSSSNGSGIYGFPYNLDDYGNPELIQHGEDVTIDNLLE